MHHWDDEGINAAAEYIAKYGVHSVRISKNSYTIHYDWHPDNFKETDIDAENT